MGRLGGRIGLGERHDTLSDIRSKWRDAIYVLLNITVLLFICLYNVCIDYRYSSLALVMGQSITM